MRREGMCEGIKAVVEGEERRECFFAQEIPDTWIFCWLTFSDYQKFNNNLKKKKKITIFFVNWGFL